jgi:hypothetical protein
MGLETYTVMYRYLLQRQCSLTTRTSTSQGKRQVMGTDYGKVFGGVVQWPFPPLVWWKCSPAFYFEVPVGTVGGAVEVVWISLQHP